MIDLRKVGVVAAASMVLASCDLPDDPGAVVDADAPVIEDVGVARQEHGGEASCTATSISGTPSESGSVVAIPMAGSQVITKSPTNHYTPSTCPHQWVVEVEAWTPAWALPVGTPAPMPTTQAECEATWVQENYYGHTTVWLGVGFTRFRVGAWNAMTSTCSFFSTYSSSGNIAPFQSSTYDKIRVAVQVWKWFEGGARIDYRPVDVTVNKIPG